MSELAILKEVALHYGAFGDAIQFFFAATLPYIC